MRVEGRTWVFGEPNVNTDLMMPAATFRMARREQSKHLFANYRPGWAESVRVGDIVIGGRNFGTGSSRPAPTLMADLGIVAVVAESLNGLFFRNCVNSGVAAAECPGIVEAVTEGDVVGFDLGTGTITNQRTGTTSTASPLPAELIEIIADGGLLVRLERGGFVKVSRGR